jgi:hypothetical protein
VWAIYAYSFVTPNKSYTKDVRAKISLESRICKKHNAKKLIPNSRYVYWNKFLQINKIKWVNIQFGSQAFKIGCMSLSIGPCGLLCLEIGPHKSPIKSPRKKGHLPLEFPVRLGRDGGDLKSEKNPSTNCNWKSTTNIFLVNPSIRG